MTGYRVYQATPVEFQIDLNVTHEYTETYKYVGASINITIPCDWAAEFDKVVAGTAGHGTDNRHPEAYRKSLEGFYNNNAQVKVAWGNAIDQIIASTMQELITMKNSILLSLAGASAERASMKLTAASNMDSYSLNISKVAEQMAYVDNVWTNLADKDLDNILRKTKDKTGVQGDQQECPGVAAAAQAQSSTNTSDATSNNLSNLGMLVNNSNMKEVLNKLCADGAFGVDAGVDDAGTNRLIAPDTLTSFNVPVQQKMFSNVSSGQYLIDAEDRLIFPCDLTAVYYDSTDNNSAANSVVNQPIQNIDVPAQAAHTGPNTYTVTWTDSIVYDVNIIFKQNVKHASDLHVGHDNVQATQEDETEGSSAHTHGAGQQIEQNTSEDVAVSGAGDPANPDGTETKSNAAAAQSAGGAGAEMLDADGNAQ